MKKLPKTEFSEVRYLHSSREALPSPAQLQTAAAIKYSMNGEEIPEDVQAKIDAAEAHFKRMYPERDDDLLPKGITPWTPKAYEVYENAQKKYGKNIPQKILAEIEKIGTEEDPNGRTG